MELPFNSLSITYEEWARTSQSWKDLLPRKNFDCTDESNESVDEYVDRHAKRFEIPFWVADQFLYGLYDNQNAVNNYGWIDYDVFRFKQVQLPIETLVKLYVIREYQPYVSMREQSIPYRQFTCLGEDKAHWQEYGTWRVPPIVLNVSALNNIPKQAEIKGPYQLVEGHSRLGYLLSHVKHDTSVASCHTVFMLDSV